MISRFDSRGPDGAGSKMRQAQEAGGTADSKKKKAPRDFDAEFMRARYLARPEGWDGINAAAFRNAMISACRLVGYKMTIAKLSVWVIADGISECDTQLVRIYGTPECNVRNARNANGGTDLRARPLWREWACNVTIQYDADQFTLQDVTHLMMRAGAQVGVGEGRPDSRLTPGIGYGTYRVDGSGTVTS